MHIRATIFAACALFVAGHANGEAAGEQSDAAPAKAFQTEAHRYTVKNYHSPIGGAFRPPQDKRCPLCDSSVYPYCGEKLLHDACCCADPYYTHDFPYQCNLADCRFLHANTCNEHRLIATCCCSDDYRSLLNSFSNHRSSESKSQSFATVQLHA